MSETEKERELRDALATRYDKRDARQARIVRAFHERNRARTMEWYAEQGLAPVVIRASRKGGAR